MSITKELRKWARQFRRVWIDPHSGDLTYITNEHACPPSLDAVRLEDYITAIADRIDEEHEAKVSYWQGASYKDGYDEGFASADDWLGQHEDAMAEHGWVRKNKEHVISHATVEVTPHIDWSRMADELDVFTQLVRGFAEQVGEDE
jgi:hypothetical protein